MAARRAPCDYNIDAAYFTGWQETFSDEFSTSPSNSAPTQWNVWEGGAFNNELQLYTSSPKNLSLVSDPANSSNSLLVIRAVKEQVSGTRYSRHVDTTTTSFSFTSARIESKQVFAPDAQNRQLRMAARIKLPSGYGMWPAFWLYGERWPTNGEIDIFEARGHEPYRYETNYLFGLRPNENMVKDAQVAITSSTSLTNCWHVYEVIWTKDSLTFLLNGQIVDVKTGGHIPDLFGKPQRLSLNLAVGGDFFYKLGFRPSPDQIPLREGEGIMLIDWVKVLVRK